MKNRFWTIVVAVCLFGSLRSGMAQSVRPDVSIGEGGTVSWADALRLGKITPAADPLSGFAAQEFYRSQIGMMGVTDIFPASSVNLEAAGLISDGTRSHDSLIMRWDQNPDPTSLNVAAWDYHFDVDPDLRGTRICFSVFAPPGIWDLSLELVDIAGRTRGWFRGMPPGVWTNYCLDPTGGLQSPFNAFFSQPGFDIRQVIAIRVNESSMGGPRWSGPIDPIIGSPFPWNAWNHLRVTTVPEPSALMLLMTGGVALSLYQWRRTRRP